MKKPHSLVIGGTRGAGRSLVKAFASEDHVVSVIGRRSPPEADQQIPNVHYWATDLTDKERLDAVLAEIVNKNGKLSNLVFLQRYRGTDDDWSGEIETTLTATKYIIEQLSAKFDDGADKSMVLVSSIFSHFVGDGQALSYHVAKAGLEQMVRYYAVALGPKGIRVNGVSPITFLKEESKDFYLRNENLMNLYRTIIPLARMGTSEEVANAIALLCSHRASFITGQNIVVDGGLSLISQETLVRKLSS
jgi:NAD(P)-dependent dehydrogenase (short-subunit alcohol dehydrogenase family)